MYEADAAILRLMEETKHEEPINQARDNKRAIAIKLSVELGGLKLSLNPPTDGNCFHSRSGINISKKCTPIKIIYTDNPRVDERYARLTHQHVRLRETTHDYARLRKSK